MLWIIFVLMYPVLGHVISVRAWWLWWVYVLLSLYSNSSSHFYGLQKKKWIQLFYYVLMFHLSDGTCYCWWMVKTNGASTNCCSVQGTPFNSSFRSEGIDKKARGNFRLLLSCNLFVNCYKCILSVLISSCAITFHLPLSFSMHKAWVVCRELDFTVPC